MLEGVNPVASKPSELISNNVQLYRFVRRKASTKRKTSDVKILRLWNMKMEKYAQCNGQLAVTECLQR